MKKLQALFHLHILFKHSNYISRRTKDFPHKDFPSGSFPRQKQFAGSAGDVFEYETCRARKQPPTLIYELQHPAVCFAPRLSHVFNLQFYHVYNAMMIRITNCEYK